MPCSPAQAAEDIPPPYQTRSARPGECGWMRLVNCSMPTVPSKSLTGSPRSARSSRSTRSFEKSSTSCVSGYSALLVVVVEHRRAHRHPGVDPPARQEVDGGQVLGQPERILQAQRDDGRAQLDAAGALAGRRHDGDRGGDAGLQVPAAQPDAVEPERFGALDHLQRLLEPRARIGGVERPMVRNPSLRSGSPRRGMAVILRHAERGASVVRHWRHGRVQLLGSGC